MPASAQMTALSRQQRLLGLLLLLILLLALGGAVAQRLLERHQPQAAREAPVPAVRVQMVQNAPFSVVRRYRGSVEAETQSLISAQTTAQVLALPWREGSQVAKGEVLVRLDDAALRQEVARLLAVGERLSGELALAQRELLRQEELYLQQHTAERLLDESRQRVQTLMAQIQENRATIALARTRLGHAEERAPFAGQVSRLLVQEGELAVAGRGLLELVAVDRLRAVLQVPQDDMALLAPGQPVALELGAGELWQGRVDRLYPTHDPELRGSRIVVMFPASAGQLKPGMAVAGEVAIAHYPQALAIPLHALHYDARESWVYLLEGEREEAVARRRGVETGHRQGGQVLILDGLAPGDPLITSADPRLEDGLRVRVVGVDG